MLLGYLHFLGLVNHDSTYLNPKCLTSSRCSLALATAHITFFGTHPTFTQVPVQQRGNHMTEKRQWEKQCVHSGAPPQVGHQNDRATVTRGNYGVPTQDLTSQCSILDQSDLSSIRRSTPG